MGELLGRNVIRRDLTFYLSFFFVCRFDINDVEVLSDGDDEDENGLELDNEGKLFRNSHRM